MAVLSNGLDTVELGRTAWREVINSNFEKIDTEAMGNKRASKISVVTTNFNKNLTSAEDTVQKALEKIDDLTISSTARNVSVVTTNFNKNLTSREDTVQKALEKLDDLVTGGGGSGIGRENTTKRNIYIGTGSNNLDATIGNNNIILGNTSVSTSATSNFQDNIVIGNDSLKTTQNSLKNIAIGNNIANSITSGSNVFVGYNARNGRTGATLNVCIGVDSGKNIGGGRGNTNLGYSSGLTRGGNYNTEIGCNRGRGSTSSRSNNTNVGKDAGYGISTSSVTNLGYLRGKNNNYTNITNLGANTACTRNNQVQLGDSTTTTYCYGRVQNRSDARDKLDIENIDKDLAINFINLLNPKFYKFNYREAYYKIEERKEIVEKTELITKEVLNEETNEVEYITEEVKYQEEILISEKIKLENDGSKRGKRKHRGLIAQEVKESSDLLGFDFAGYQDHSLSGEDVKSLGYQEFIPFLIQNIKYLNEKVKDLEAIINNK